MATLQKKHTIIIGIVVILVVVAIAYFAISGGDSEKKDEVKDVYSLYLTEDSGRTTVSSIDTKLLVFGNANNDVYLDSKDVSFIQDIVDGKTKWDVSANPLADTNADGKITSDDVSLLKRFIAGEESSMFYLNSYLDVNKVKWPMTGKIAVRGNPDIEILKILGADDRIVYTSATYPYEYEKVVGSGATITMGMGSYMYDDAFLSAVKAGYDSFPIDTLRLHESRLINNIEGVAVTVTIGALFNAYGHGTYDAYLSYAEEVRNIISKATANISADQRPSFLFLTSDACKSPGELGMDAESSSLENYADIGAAKNLKMVSSYPIVSGSGYLTGLSIENILKYAPDVLFIEYTESGDYEAYSAKVSQIAGWFRSAGYDGKMIAVNYSVLGNSPSASILPLMTSYIYGETAYSSEDGWKQLMTFCNTFLDGDFTIDTIKQSKYAAWIVE